MVLAKLTGFSAFATEPTPWSFPVGYRYQIQQTNNGGNNMAGNDLRSGSGQRTHNIFNRSFPLNKVSAPFDRYRKNVGQNSTAANAFKRTVKAVSGEPLVKSCFP